MLELRARDPDMVSEEARSREKRATHDKVVAGSNARRSQMRGGEEVEDLSKWLL